MMSLKTITKLMFVQLSNAKEYIDYMWLKSGPGLSVTIEQHILRLCVVLAVQDCIFPIRVIQRRLGRANLPWGQYNGVLLSWWPFDELHIRPLDKDKAWVDFPQGQGKEGSTLFPKEEAVQVTFHEWQALISSMLLQNTSHSVLKVF